MHTDISYRWFFVVLVSNDWIFLSSEAKRVVHFPVFLPLAFCFRMARSLICLAFPNRLPAAYLCLFNGGVCVSLPTRFVGVDVRSWYDNLRLGMYARAGEVNSSLQCKNIGWGSGHSQAITNDKIQQFEHCVLWF